MNEPNFMHAWAVLVGSLAMIALILTPFGVMLGIVKPAEVLRRSGAILGVVTLLMVIPSVFANIWSSMSLWQRLALAALGIGVCLLRPRPESRKR